MICNYNDFLDTIVKLEGDKYIPGEEEPTPSLSSHSFETNIKAASPSQYGLYHSNKNFKMRIILPDEAHFYCCKCKADRNMKIEISESEELYLQIYSEINNSEDEPGFDSLLSQALEQLNKDFVEGLNSDGLSTFLKSKMDERLEKRTVPK